MTRCLKNVRVWTVAAWFLAMGFASALPARGQEILATLDRQVEEFYEAGNYADALPFAKKALEAAATRFGEHHIETIKHLDKVAQLESFTGNVRDAETLYRGLLSIREKVLGDDHVDVASNLISLAGLVWGQQRSDEARDLYGRALKILEKSEPTSLQTAAALYALAELSLEKGRNADAADYYRRALPLYEAGLGPRDATVAMVLGRQASLAIIEGHPESAEPLLKRTLEINDEKYGPENTITLQSLDQLAYFYENQAQYAEAEPLHRRALAIREKTEGQDAVDTANSALHLALTYIHQGGGRAKEAKELAERALAIREKAFGPDHVTTADALAVLIVANVFLGNLNIPNDVIQRIIRIRTAALGKGHKDTLDISVVLAHFLQLHSRFDEAEALFKQILEIKTETFGRDHLETIKTVQSLASLYALRANFAMADQLFREALAVRERMLGGDHLDVAESLADLAGLYYDQGRFQDSELLYRRAIEIREKKLGPDHFQIVFALGSLANVLSQQGNEYEAETLLKRAIASTEKTFGPNHAIWASTIFSLGNLYQNQGRYADAEGIFRRMVGILMDTVGRDHPFTATSLNSLAEVLRLQGRYPEAELLLKEVLAIREKTLGPESPSTLETLNNLALLYYYTGRYLDSESLNKRALAGQEKILGPEHVRTAASLGSLALVYDNLGRFAEAEPLHRRDIAIREKTYGLRHNWTATSYGNLAWHFSLQKEWPQALGYYDRATEILLQSIKSGIARVAPGAAVGREVTSGFSKYFDHVRAIYWASQQSAQMKHQASARAFEFAQWALYSDASDALAQMAARFGSGGSDLAALVREKQDLAVEWTALDVRLSNAFAKSADTRDSKAETIIRARIGEIESRSQAINKAIAEVSPRYADLSFPGAITLRDAQRSLASDEVLIQFLVSEQESFVWVVTNERKSWVQIPIGWKVFAPAIRAMRCGLSSAEWVGSNRSAECLQLLGLKQAWKSGEPLPFHFEFAHRLYNQLLGSFEREIEGKKLIIIPSGPLTSLPFHLLVTKKPVRDFATNNKAYLETAWLGLKHAITILPSASSLKSLRDEAGRSPAKKAFLGIGDPELEGNRVTWTKVAKQAWEGVADFFRGNLADVKMVRALEPLPDTSAELTAIARTYHAGGSEVLLRNLATEATVKKLSRDGELENYRIIHFATHGLVAGELGGLAEPALVLTPPDEPTREDDGLLTASEIAQLRLNADWVILSACHTAGTEIVGGRGLSGLVRAFFYAGARSLLVSHWPVYSAAAVELTTRMFSELERHAGIGRAEALQRSMLALMRSGGAHAHPAYWGPFIVVGEGQ